MAGECSQHADFRQFILFITFCYIWKSMAGVFLEIWRENPSSGNLAGEFGGRICPPNCTGSLIKFPYAPPMRGNRPRAQRAGLDQSHVWIVTERSQQPDKNRDKWQDSKKWWDDYLKMRHSTFDSTEISEISVKTEIKALKCTLLITVYYQQTQ